jgi:hypothetical protein
MTFTGESPSGRNSISEDAVNFSAIARAFFSAGSVPATLSSVVELAASTVEGCDYAGLFLIEGNVISTPAFTDPMVVEIDDLQLQTGQGPCLDAISHRLTFYSTDLARDLRWLHFAPAPSGWASTAFWPSLWTRTRNSAPSACLHATRPPST